MGILFNRSPSRMTACLVMFSDNIFPEQIARNYQPYNNKMNGQSYGVRVIRFFYPGLVLCFLLTACSSGKFPYQEGYIDSGDGVRLFYQKLGDGEQKIVIPLGFWMYDDFKHLVNRDRTLVFYDMRNRFRSSSVTDSTAISIEKDVLDLEAIRQYFDFDRISLIGESYLGLMIIQYALDHPDKIDRMIQIGAVPYHHAREYPDSLRHSTSQVDTVAYKKIRTLFEEGYHERYPEDFSLQYWNTVQKINLVADTTFVRRLGEQWGAHLNYENEWFPNISRQISFHFKSIRQLHLTPEIIGTLSHPVLTIHGTHDRNAPYGSGREWAGLLPEARLLTVHGAAHIPWIEQPELVFTAIDTFLRGKWPDGAVNLRGG